MSVLADAATAVKAHLIAQGVQVDPIVASVPVNPVEFAGYVWAAADWVTAPENGTFCAKRSVGLVLDLCASVLDLAQSSAWLADRVDEAWTACAHGVPLPGGDETAAERVGAPFIIRNSTGTELLVARVEFARFDLED